MKRIRLSAIAIAAIGMCAVSNGQSLNIDLDVLTAPPELGGGVPSSGFGAAAGQPGFWNRVGNLIGAPIPLADLQGNVTGVTMMRTGDHPGGVGAFFFPGNTGDYALLLNDAEQVATLGPGGTLTYTFSGLAPGAYDIYTFAVHIAGLMSNTPIFVAEASHSNTQVVTGPMPGNAFEYLITHSIHHVVLGIPGEFHVSITQPPNHPQGMNVNGFQIVMVPEPSSALAVAFGIAILLFRFNKSRRHQPGHGSRVWRGMKTSKLGFTGLFLAMTAACAMPQSFNLDLNMSGGSPTLGAGVPSSVFGAAAAQPGFWNAIHGVNGATQMLVGRVD